MKHVKKVTVVKASVVDDIVSATRTYIDAIMAAIKKTGGEETS